MERVEKTQGQEQKKTFEELWGNGQFINIKCIQKTQEVLERNLRKIQLDKIRITRYKRIEETSKNIRRHRTTQYTKAVFKEILEKIKLRESQINNQLNLDEKCNSESAMVKTLIKREKHTTIASHVNIENSYTRFICVDDMTTKDIIPPLVRTRRKIQYPTTYSVTNNTLSTSSLDNTVSSKNTTNSVEIYKNPAKRIPTDSVMNNTLSTSCLENTVSSKNTKNSVEIDKNPAKRIPTDSVMNNTLSTSCLDNTVSSKYTKRSVKIDRNPTKSIRSIVVTIPNINTDASQGQRSSLVESPTEGSSTNSEHSNRLDNYHAEKEHISSTQYKSAELPPIRVIVKSINRLPVSYFAETDNSISVCSHEVPPKMVSTRNSSIGNNNMVNFRITHETPSMVVSPRNSSVSIPLVRKEMGKYNNMLSITGKNPQLTTDQNSQLSLDENP